MFNIDEVECAILEINGSLSVLKKNNTKMPPSRIYQYCPQQVLYRLNWSMTEKSYMITYPHTYNEGWLMAELKKRNLVVFDISYAVVGTKGNLYIDLIKDQ
ncbi:DUF421 domain-containing protein [[Brevibacterium] frigoritolerans]|uniref:DUF421 domain-containing protein n=1 Tax=Peribacillus frigoritolerans TaxID=450367 RepID=A0A941J723_9BACI|nr:DUF421 domain-containing protein [Peribacillus frigoritolerans]